MALEKAPSSAFSSKSHSFQIMLAPCSSFVSCFCWGAFVAFCSGFSLPHKSYSWKRKEAQVKARWIYHNGTKKTGAGLIAAGGGIQNQNVPLEIL